MFEGVRIEDDSQYISDDEENDDHRFSLDANLSSRRLSIKDGKSSFTSKQSFRIIESFYVSPTNLLKGENLRNSFTVNSRIAMDDDYTANIFDAPLSMSSSSDDSCKFSSELPTCAEESNSVVTLDLSSNKLLSFRTELASECPFLQLQEDFKSEKESPIHPWDLHLNHNQNCHSSDGINELESSTNQLLLNESCTVDMDAKDIELPSLHRTSSNNPDELLQSLESQLMNLFSNSENAIFLPEIDNISMYTISPYVSSLSKTQERTYRMVFYLREQIAELFIETRDFASALIHNMHLIALLHALLPRFSIHSLISFIAELESGFISDSKVDGNEDTAIFNLYYDRILVAEEVRVTETMSLHETLMRQRQIDTERSNYQCLKTFMEMIMSLISDTSLLWGELLTQNDHVHDTEDTRTTDLPHLLLNDCVDHLRITMSNCTSNTTEGENDAPSVSNENLLVISNTILETLHLILLLHQWWRVEYLKEVSMEESTITLLLRIAQSFFEQERWNKAIVYFTIIWSYLEGQPAALTPVDVLEWQAQVSVSLSLCYEQLQDVDNYNLFLRHALLLRETLYGPNQQLTDDVPSYAQHCSNANEEVVDNVGDDQRGKNDSNDQIDETTDTDFTFLERALTTCIAS